MTIEEQISELGHSIEEFANCVNALPGESL
jgi:hypothetical protein